MSIWYKKGTPQKPMYFVAEPSEDDTPPKKKMVSLKAIPPAVIAHFNKGTLEVNDDAVDLSPPQKVCIFCGAANCAQSRMLNSEIIYLCDEHYYSKNLGQIAQQVRESEHAEKAETTG